MINLRSKVDLVINLNLKLYRHFNRSFERRNSFLYNTVNSKCRFTSIDVAYSKWAPEPSKFCSFKKIGEDSSLGLHHTRNGMFTM